MFHLSTGPYRDLESAFLKDVSAHKSSDPLGSLLVLSPSGQILNRLQRRLAESQAYLNIHFLTFFALAERVLGEAPAGEGNVVTEPALYRELIQDFLEGRAELPFISRDQLFRRGPVPRGLTGALAATLKDLQDSGARVVDCANVVREGHLGEAATPAIPILELNVLLYKALHDRNLRTSADRIRRAADRVPKSPWIQGQKAVYLYGFYDLTGVQLDLILALASHANARLYFPYEEGNPAYGYAELLLKDPALISKTRRHGDTGTRGHDGLDSSPRHPVSASPRRTIEAYSFSGSHNEAWWVAKQILKQADAGVPFTEMAVVARTLEPYQNTLREVLETHRIPFALHAEEPVGTYPLVKHARALMQEARVEYSDTWSGHVIWTLSMLANEIKLERNASPTEKAIWEGLQKAIHSFSELDIIGRPVPWARFVEVMNDKLDSLRLPLSPTDIAGVQVMDIMTARGLGFDTVFVLGLNEKLFPRLIREDPFLSDAARSGLAQALGCRLGRKMDGYQEEKLLFHLATQLATRHLHLSCQRSDEEGKALVISLYLHDYLKKTGLTLEPLPRSWQERMPKVDKLTLTPKEVSIAFHREHQAPDELYTTLDWNHELLVHLLEAQKETEAFGALSRHDGLIGKDDPQALAILEKGISPQTLKDLAECPFKIFARKVLELYTDAGDTEDGVLTHSGRGKLIHRILQTFYQNKCTLADLDKLAEDEFKLINSPDSDLYPLAWEAEKAKILAMLRRFIPLDQANQAETGFTPTYFELPLSGEINGVKLQGRIDRLDLAPPASAKATAGKRDSSAEAAFGEGGYRVVDYKSGSGGIKNGEAVDTAIMKGKSFQLPVYLALAKTWLEAQKGLPAGALAQAGSALFYQLQEEDTVEEPLEIGPDFWTKHGERFYENLAFLVKNIETGAFYIRPSDSRGYCSWCDYKSICRKEHKPTQTRSKNSPKLRGHEDAFKSVIRGQ